MWGRDGKHLYYRDGQWFVEVTYTTSPSFTITARRNVVKDDFVRAQSPHANYDIAPDGQHLLVVKSVEASKVIVVWNWGAELRARMAGRK